MEEAQQYSAVIGDGNVTNSYLFSMLFAWSYLLATSAEVAAQMAVEEDKAEAVTLPSGLEVKLHEILSDQNGEAPSYRFRFVAPKLIESGLSEDSRVTDMKFLCEEYAVPKLSESHKKPLEVVISMADKVGEFGIYDPEITEFFEFYRIKDNACTWELY